MTTGPVVTGIGVTAPTGIGVGAHWCNTLDGRGGIGRITRFDPDRYPLRVAGELPGFAAEEYVPGRLAVQTDRWTHLGLAAAEMALHDAALCPETLPDYSMGVVTASSSGGTEFGQREIERLWRHGPQHVGAYQSIAWFYAATTGQMSIRHGLRGPCGVICTEQAGGLDAIAQARRAIADGTPHMLAGGHDGSLCPYGLVAQFANGRLARSDDPATAYLPFDRRAHGYVPGEGGAMFVVEDRAAALARDAPQMYGVLAGYAATFDPPPGRGRRPNLGAALQGAMDDAGVAPRHIDVVFADAAADPEADAQEADAIRGVFGARGVPVTAPKTMTGRLYAGGAALDLATALMAIRDAVIPPTAGVTEPVERYGLDLVTGRPRPARVERALVLARGHGGFNAALVVTADRST